MEKCYHQLLFEIVKGMRKCPEYIPLIEKICNVSIDRNIFNEEINLGDIDFYILKNENGCTPKKRKWLSFFNNIINKFKF